ncbi:hypothetical protein Sjap_008689 [Stephania japonica]|uniref:Uncharacterized protein n=1 Tax=Stephania japonica TaxID=461633 RepID=A0AAP0JQV1_9MAGN
MASPILSHSHRHPTPPLVVDELAPILTDPTVVKLTGDPSQSLSFPLDSLLTLSSRLSSPLWTGNHHLPPRHWNLRRSPEQVGSASSRSWSEVLLWRLYWLEVIPERAAVGGLLGMLYECRDVGSQEPAGDALESRSGTGLRLVRYPGVQQGQEPSIWRFPQSSRLQG